MKVKRWSQKILQTKNESPGILGELQEENVECDEGQVEKGENADDGREECLDIQKTMTCANPNYDDQF